MVLMLLIKSWYTDEYSYSLSYKSSMYLFDFFNMYTLTITQRTLKMNDIKNNIFDWLYTVKKKKPKDNIMPMCSALSIFLTNSDTCKLYFLDSQFDI